MPSRLARQKVEITKKQFEDLLSSHPDHRMERDVIVIGVKMRGLTWNKPLAYAKDGKYFKFND